MKKIIIAVVLLTSIKTFGTEIGLAALREAQKDYENNRSSDATVKFLNIYNQDYSPVSIAYLQKLSRYITDASILREISDLMPTHMAKNEVDFSDSLKNKKKKSGQNLLRQITNLNTCQNRTEVMANMGKKDAVLEILRLSRSEAAFYTQLSSFLFSAAKKDVVPYQALLAQALGEGDGVFKKNQEKSIFWKTKAIETYEKNPHGVLEAGIGSNISLGSIYFNLGVDLNITEGHLQDKVRAAQMFEKAAELNFPHAAQDLIIILENDLELFPDEKERTRKIKKWSLIMGDRDSLLRAALYQRHYPENEEEKKAAFKTLQDFARKRNPMAQFEVAEMFYDNKQFEASAQMMEKVILNKDQLNAPQKVRLGLYMLHQNCGVLNRQHEAFELFLSAQSSGISADGYLGNCYEYAFGVARDDEKAAEYYQNAMNDSRIPEEKKVDVWNNLGVLHMQKRIENYDFTKAHELFDLAISYGNTTAMYNKAYMINHALGCDRDLAEVIRLYTLAQEAGDADAMSNLGLIYMEQERFDLARPCLERASELGNKNGIFNKLLLDFTEGKCLQDIHTQEKSIQERFFRAISNLLKENATQENIDSAKSALTEIIEISQDPDMTQNAQDLLDYAQNLLMSNKGSSGEEETLDWKEDLKQELAQYANKNKKNQRNKKQETSLYHRFNGVVLHKNTPESKSNKTTQSIY